MFLPKGASLNDFFRALASSAIQVVSAAAKKAKAPPPSLKNPPNNVNPKAKEKYWKEFVKKYESVWKKYNKDVDKQWSCCVAIWVNYVIKRKMQPFDSNSNQVGQETREKLDTRVRSARNTQLKALEVLLSRGSRMGVVSKFLKETFRSIEEKKPGEFSILTQRVMKLEKGIEWDSKEFKAFMSKSNFQRKYGKYVRDVKTNASLVIMLDEETERPLVLLRNVLTKSYAEMLLNIPNERGNKEALKKGLVKFWKSMLRESS